MSAGKTEEIKPEGEPKAEPSVDELKVLPTKPDEDAMIATGLDGKEQVVDLPSEEELRKEVFERAKDVKEKGYPTKVLHEILSNLKINLRDEVKVRIARSAGGEIVVYRRLKGKPAEDSTENTAVDEIDTTKPKTKTSPSRQPEFEQLPKEGLAEFIRQEIQKGMRDTFRSNALDIAKDYDVEILEDSVDASSPKVPLKISVDPIVLSYFGRLKKKGLDGDFSQFVQQAILDMMKGSSEALMWVRRAEIEGVE